jgi:hypothetical protein
MTGISLVSHQRSDDFKKLNMSSDVFRIIEQFGNMNVMFLDIIHRPIFIKNTTFRSLASVSVFR